MARTSLQIQSIGVWRGRNGCGTIVREDCGEKILKKYDGIHKPLQKRSQETAERILDAFDLLLREKSLDDITMQELSAESKAGISSIYARFNGKDAMLVALHEKITGDSVKLVKELMERLAEVGDDTEAAPKLIQQLLKVYFAFAAKNKHIYRAIMLSNHDFAYERIIAQNHAASRMGFEFFSKIPGISRRGLEDRVDMVVRLISSTCQQMWFFGDKNPSRIELSNEQLAKQLAAVITPYLLG